MSIPIPLTVAIKRVRLATVLIGVKRFQNQRGAISHSCFHAGGIWVTPRPPVPLPPDSGIHHRMAHNRSRIVSVAFRGGV